MIWVLLAALSGIFIVLWIFLLSFAFSLLSSAPFVPSARRRVRTMIELADIKPGTRVTDLGSGDGRLLIEAARRGAVCEGWEINPVVAWWSRAMIRRAGLTSLISIHTNNFWHASLGNFDVVFTYLLPERMPRLKEKVQRELHKGAAVVSNGFLFPDWTPDLIRDNVRRYRL